jgi:hypothetical protein
MGQGMYRHQLEGPAAERSNPTQQGVDYGYTGGISHAEQKALLPLVVALYLPV